MTSSGVSAKELAAHLTRNAEACWPSGQLADLLEQRRPLRVKLGIDPTAPDIHLGHTVVLQKLREFQDAGHVVVLVIGDFTARVGDPTGRSASRPQLEMSEIDANAATFAGQANRVLDSRRLEIRRNSEWLDMRTAQLFELMRCETVARLIERDDFAKRIAAAQPISLLELLYPLLQGFDSVAVHADIEIGGTDQTFNLMQGRELQRQYGQRPQVVLTMPILVGLDGRKKMSKTAGNHVGVTEAAAEMYGKVMSVPDDAMRTWFSLLLGEEPPAKLNARDSKRTLARRLAERFHGVHAAVAAEAQFDRVFVARGEPEDIAEVDVEIGDAGAVHLPAVIATAFQLSRAEARRRIDGGAVRLDGEAVPTGTLDLNVGSVDGRVLRVGKRNWARVRVR